MNITTKFKIGEEVYIIFKKENDQILQLFKDKVIEIVINENDILYYGNVLCEEFKENQLISFNNKELLVEKIDELIKNGDK